MKTPPRQTCLQTILAWAARHEDIRALAVVGSGARSQNPADDWSDLDLVLVVSNPQDYFSAAGWLAEIGKPWATLLEHGPQGTPLEVRVLYAGGVDVDWIIVPVEMARQKFAGHLFLPEIIQRGFCALLDKDHLLDALPEAQTAASSGLPPTPEAYLAAVNDFWFHVAWTAKKLQRGENWVAKACCDHYLKALLLRMVEWEAQAAHNWVYDTWFNGRFLEEWALPETLAELKGAFAHYEQQDIWRALSATVFTFDRIAQNLARQLNYSYPQQDCEQIYAWIFEERGLGES